MKKLSFTPLLLFLCCFFFNGLWGQTPTVKTVWFWPPKENAKVFLKIKNDDTGEFYQAPQSLPPISIKDATKSWDNNQILAPVSYVSGYAPRVEADFQNANTNNSCVSIIYARGEVYIDDVLIASLPSKVLEGNKKYSVSKFMNAPVLVGDFTFEKYVVRFIPEMKIKWFTSTTPNQFNSWVSAGDTKHRLYITHKRPLNYYAENSYETCYYLSCQSAHGKGLSQGDPDVDDVTLRIYDEFQDRDVKKFNGTKSMTYWGPTTNSTACNSIGQLLINENTTCGIWSDFLVEMHTLHGIKSNPKTVFYGDSYHNNSSVGGFQGVLTLEHSEACSLAVQNYFGSLDNIEFFTISFTKNCFAGFHVKNWNFASQDNFFLSRQADAPIQVNNHTISYLGLGSIPCQGYNSDPVPNHVPISFANHAIVEYKSKDGTLWYFDPSYGSPVSDDPQNYGTWENSSLEGYGVPFIYRKNPANPIPVVWLREIESASTTQTRLKN
jgi:hypothetical protein